MSKKNLTSTAFSEALTGSISKNDQLEAIAQAAVQYYYTPEQEFDDANKQMVIDAMRGHIKPGHILELGYTNDIWTKSLLSQCESIDVIEAAENHVKRGQQDFANDDRVTIIQTLFEDYKPTRKYDTILMSGVIKHVPNDLDFLKLARTWLAPGGVVIACTPNSRSFHRRLGAYMGLEHSPDEHNLRDKEVFNVHLYDRFSWRALFLKAGYDVTHLQGVFLKILSTTQMMYLAEKYDVTQIMEGLQQLGEELQDYAWYVFLVARSEPDEKK